MVAISEALDGKSLVFCDIWRLRRSLGQSYASDSTRHAPSSSPPSVSGTGSALSV